MQRALELALLGKRNVAPNPMVGCVIVHNNLIIGEGYHQQYGSAHAEPNALANVTDSSLLKESTLYVNLEPCNHFGKTPPCADAIVASGIKKVVIANEDPYIEVRGQGIRLLQKNGIEVISGILAIEGAELNKRFFTFHKKKRPYVILKWAQTADGFLDKKRNKNEKPLQISNTENSALVHQWRSEESAILVGMNTVIMDNPSLSVRNITGKNPLRITIDNGSKYVNYKQYKLFNKEIDTLVYTTTKSNKKDNLEYVKLPSLELNKVLNDLFSRNIQSIIVEGGAKMLDQFIRDNLWDETRISSNHIKIENGIKAPLIKGALKDKFNCGKECNVSLFSPLK